MAKPSLVEKVWKTEAGLKAAVIFTRQKFRCGYVGVPKEHPLFELHYDSNSPYLAELTGDEEIGSRGLLSVICGQQRMQSPVMVFDVHGSLTFSDFWKPEGEESKELKELDDGLWYFGFDCAHAGDGQAPDLDEHGDIVHSKWQWTNPVRSLEYVTQQCESLAAQIVAKTLPLKGIGHDPE